MYIPNEILKIKKLNNCDILLLGLIYQCNSEICYISQEMAKNKTGYSLRSVGSSFKNLFNYGFIEYIQVPNKRYKLIKPTELFFKYFKKKKDIKKSYKDYRKKEKSPIFKKPTFEKMTDEEMTEGRELLKNVFGTC